MDQRPSNQDMQSSGQSAPQKGNRMLSAVIGIVVAVVAGAYVMMQKKQTPSQTTENSADSTKTVPEAGSSSGDQPSNTAPEANMPASTNQGEPVPNEPSAGTGQAPAMAVSEYKDGTYTAVGNYVSPGGPEQVGVTLTLKNDVIVDSSFEIKATRPISLQKQTIFSENYKQFVIGKNIDEVNVTKVSSSSLTPKGFMDALNKIEADAKS